MDLNQKTPAPLTGTMLLEVLFKIGFLADKTKGIALMEEVVEKIDCGAFSLRQDSGRSRKRILITGVPIGIGSDKGR